MTVENSDYHPTLRFGKMTGRRFLVGMILVFGVIFAVNGFFIFKALSTFDGIEIDDAYQRGRAYNKDLAAMEAQKAQGWKAELSDPVTRGGVTHFVARFADRNGVPLQGLKINATFWRPVSTGDDRTELMREVAPGRYEADFTLAHEGNWIVRVAAQGAGGKYADEMRAFVKQVN